ncbi:MAG: phosphate ABC transporter permease subunit PstC, partial [Fusobacteria bacterium]|nr:phosphate ABC transporter permease subunit PstC [Fusobacteriota bacterium]
MFKLITKFCALLIVLVMGLLVIVFIWRTLPTLTGFGAKFIWGVEWNPVTGQFGALTAILGTLVTSVIAIIIAVPFSFWISVLLTEMLPTKLSAFFSRVIELMAAI